MHSSLIKMKVESSPFISVISIQKEEISEPIPQEWDDDSFSYQVLKNYWHFKKKGRRVELRRWSTEIYENE